MWSPTLYEPVKVTAAIDSFVTNSSPTMLAGPVTTLITFSGNPASSKISASFNPVRGVIEAGLKTTEFPAASAGAIFRAGIASGKFHGVITETTPSGSLKVYRNVDGSSAGNVSPASR